MKKLRYFIPSIILMVIIFSFSNQTGNESSGLSQQIVLWIQTHLHMTIPELIIRKSAHMSEYALLCLTFIYAFSHYQLTMKQVLFYSIFCSFAYACSDEIHQLFIGGRAGQFTDVLIDTSGACFMSIICYFIIKYRKR